MKDAKFIELLNLYVDQEITADDAALLEAEIAHNAEHRKIYMQYCRMHRASTVLFESFKSGAIPSGGKLAEAARSAESKMSVFPGKRSWRWAYGASFAAVAASFAFVLAYRNSSMPAKPDAVSSPVVAQHSPQAVRQPLAPQKQQPKTMSVASSATSQSSDSAYRPVFQSRPLGNRDRASQHDVVLASSQVDLDWMKRVHLQPLRGVSVEELIFENEPVQVQDLRAFGLQRQTQGKTEMGAFQFEK
ncbi:MAG: hypothetical protein WC378_02185 [Opitutaceae bacterium]|jgi:hypothetical protein